MTNKFRIRNGLIKDIGLTPEQADIVVNEEKCPFCGFEFVSYPTGWAWVNHIEDCKAELRQSKQDGERR